MNKNKIVLSAALVFAMIVGAFGGSMLNARQANAASTTTPTTTQTQQGMPTGQFDPAKGGHIGANGIREALLTGDTAEKVKAAATAAVAGGTVESVETDAEGSPYEAHMKKSAGSRVTVKVDTNFHPFQGCLTFFIK